MCAAPAVKAIPAGHEHFIPHLIVDDAPAALAFYAKAFGAKELFRMMMPGGKRVGHAEMKIGDLVFYLSDEFPEFSKVGPRKLGGSPLAIHRYVPDVDKAVARAVAAGATATMPVADMFWGDRYGTLTDPFGHRWSLATHIRDVPPDELEAAAAKAFAEPHEAS
ncbi:MAG: VOC family protein [Rhodospirillales bacterium]|nr:VOC family protein [Rhodospirillales bacterium]